jgi:hypothetical protein
MIMTLRTSIVPPRNCWLLPFCGIGSRWGHGFRPDEWMSAAVGIDGQAALAWQANSSGAGFYDNCRSSAKTFCDTIRRTGIDLRKVQIVGGFFE